MFFNNKKILNFLADYFAWTDDHVLAMTQSYYNTLHRLIINEAIDYIDKHDIPEKTEFNSKLYDTKVVDGGLAKQSELIKLLASLTNKYPELTESIKIKIELLNEELFTETVANLDEAAAIKILEIINEDLDAINKFSAKYSN